MSFLGDYGIHGNGHFLFLEKNNMDSAALVAYGLNKMNSGPAAPGHPKLPISVS